MILVLSDQFDTHADLVCSKFESKNMKYFRLNLDVESLQNTSISFDSESWVIGKNGIKLELNDITAVWARRAFVEVLLDENTDDIGFKIWKGEWNKTLIGLYFHLVDRKWLNSLPNAYRAENKYIQLDTARKIGFLLPKFFVSNEKSLVSKFIGDYDKVVLKPQNQEFYSDSSDSVHKGMYVNIVPTHSLEDFSGLNENPVFLQTYIEKKYEVRYTFVNNKHYVCRIDSQKSNKTRIDWRRYDIPNTPHVSMSPPLEIKEKVELFMSEMNLEFGALDFIVTPDNDWYFLEVNPMGQWLWIENLTNLNISDAIVDFYQ